MQSKELVKDEGGTFQKPVIKVETESLHYTRATGNYTSGTRVTGIGYTLVKDIGVHFWRSCLQHTDVLEYSSYPIAGCIFLTYRPWTNEINQTPPLQRLPGFVGISIYIELNAFHALIGTEERMVDK